MVNYDICEGVLYSTFVLMWKIENDTILSGIVSDSTALFE